MVKIGYLFCSYCCLFCGLVGLVLVGAVGWVWLRLFVPAVVFVWCFCLELVGCFVLTLLLLMCVLGCCCYLYLCY